MSIDQTTAPGQKPEVFGNVGSEQSSGKRLQFFDLHATPVVPVKLTSVVSAPAVVTLKNVPRPVPPEPHVWVQT